MMAVIKNYGEFRKVFTWRTDSLTTKLKIKINIRAEHIQKRRKKRQNNTIHFPYLKI